MQDIPLSQLHAHPLNANRMDDRSLEKLRRHIQRTATYEPLTVRPHHELDGAFEIINGHHRALVLHKLGHATARCVIWNVNDEQTKLYLATLNRLRGTDVPERRAVLISSLLEDMQVDALAQLLPENEDQLRQFVEAICEEVDSHLKASRPKPCAQDHAVIMEFLLDEDGASVVNRALGAAISATRCAARGEALVQVCSAYVMRG